MKHPAVFVILAFLALSAPLVADSFDEPVTVKETKKADGTLERLYFQGKDLILEQLTDVKSEITDQSVFYKKTLIADDRRRNTAPGHASRKVYPHPFKIILQWLDADAMSPAKLRIISAENPPSADGVPDILCEFFIDKNGLMRPITRAEHDEDLAAREKALNKR